MSREDNVAVVRAMYAAHNRGDFEVALSYLAPDVSADPGSSLITGVYGTYEGHDGLRRWQRETREKGIEVTFKCSTPRPLTTSWC